MSPTFFALLVLAQVPPPPTTEPALPVDPAAPMTAFAYLAGDWRAEVEDPGHDGGPPRRYETSSSFAPVLGGVGLVHTLTMQGEIFGVERSVRIQGTLAWDLFRKTFRLVYLDDASGLLDVFEGGLDGDVLTVSNVRADTSYVTTKGAHVYTRIRLAPRGKDEVTLEVDGSRDGGKTWERGTRVRLGRLPRASAGRG